jgi:hypothetical protein
VTSQWLPIPKDGLINQWKQIDGIRYRPEWIIRYRNYSANHPSTIYEVLVKTISQRKPRHGPRG